MPDRRDVPPHDPAMPAAPPAGRARRLTTWLDRGVWLVLSGILLYRCVLPLPADRLDPALAAVRVETRGQPVFIAFDGSR